MANDLTIVVPAFNDAIGLQNWLPDLLSAAEKHDWSVIIVDDASIDNTLTFLKEFDGRLSIVRHKINSGYGAALKSGILAARTRWVATMDADGQHRIEDLETMYGQLESSVDALIGVRTQESYTPFVRRPGKWVLKHIANTLSGVDIPDINCGLRIFRRDIIMQFFSITSDRYSFSTSCLIALVQCRCRIRYISVIVKPRIGKSAVKQARDGLYTCLLILRLIFLFRPARVLLPVGLVSFSLALGILLIHLFVAKMTATTIITWVTGLLILLISLLADQVSGIRRDLFMRSVGEVYEQDRTNMQTQEAREREVKVI
jgi:glycosyltransferase involved in cell wall biosynthesis